VAVTIARGLRTVGTSPLLVVSSFLSTLVLWLVFVAYGIASSAQAMALVTSIAPVHSLLADIGAVVTVGSGSAGTTLVFLAGLLVVRSAILSFTVAAILERLEGTNPPGAGGTGSIRKQVPVILRRAARSFPSMLGIEAGFYILAMATAFIAVGFGLGQLAVIAGLIGGIYFFVFAPIAAMAEGAGPRTAARLSITAAKLPGPRHMMATAAYIAFALIVSLFAPTSRVFSATPTITDWLFVLFVAFLHVGALATFTYRWRIVRDRVVPKDAGRPRRARDRSEPAPLR
jgi:hypothetical protein